MRTPIEVLLIEDDPGDVLLIREWLQVSRTADYRLEHADRLSAAQKSLKEGHFDVVLVDLGLPDSQGLDTVRRVRAQAPRRRSWCSPAWKTRRSAFKPWRKGARTT